MHVANNSCNLNYFQDDDKIFKNPCSLRFSLHKFMQLKVFNTQVCASKVVLDPVRNCASVGPCSLVLYSKMLLFQKGISKEFWIKIETNQDQNSDVTFTVIITTVQGGQKKLNLIYGSPIMEPAAKGYFWLEGFEINLLSPRILICKSFRTP